MAKYYGKIGFVKYVKGEDSIYEQEIIEKYYRGDLLTNTRRNETSSEKISEDIRLGNELSIIANAFALENFAYMRYVVFLGIKWAIVSARIEAPRIILSFGGVYNGPEGPSETD